MNKKYQGIAWNITKVGVVAEKIIPGLEFLFREGDVYPITPQRESRDDVVADINARKKQILGFGKERGQVFDIEELRK